MREIKFRAKDYTGEWRYGCLLERKYFDFKHGKDASMYYISSIEPDWTTSNIYTNKEYLVISNTIGQYTGLKDKNGTKIFEGDIVEFETNVNCITSELKPYWKDCIEKQMAIGNGTYWVRKDQGVVQWNAKNGMWDLKVYNNGKYKRKSKLFTFRESDYIVIGNI